MGPLHSEGTIDRGVPDCKVGTLDGIRVWALHSLRSFAVYVSLAGGNCMTAYLYHNAPCDNTIMAPWYLLCSAQSLDRGQHSGGGGTRG